MYPLHGLFCPWRVFLSVLFSPAREMFLGIACLVLPFPLCHICCLSVPLAAEGLFSSCLLQSGLTSSRQEIAGQEKAIETENCHHRSKSSHQGCREQKARGLTALRFSYCTLFWVYLFICLFIFNFISISLHFCSLNNCFIFIYLFIYKKRRPHFPA